MAEQLSFTLDLDQQENYEFRWRSPLRSPRARKSLRIWIAAHGSSRTSVSSPRVSVAGSRYEYGCSIATAPRFMRRVALRKAWLPPRLLDLEEARVIDPVNALLSHAVPANLPSCLRLRKRSSLPM